jgi:hypothetical protein
MLKLISNKQPYKCYLFKPFIIIHPFDNRDCDPLILVDLGIINV